MGLIGITRIHLASGPGSLWDPVHNHAMWAGARPNLAKACIVIASWDSQEQFRVPNFTVVAWTHSVVVVSGWGSHRRWGHQTTWSLHFPGRCCGRASFKPLSRARCLCRGPDGSLPSKLSWAFRRLNYRVGGGFNVTVSCSTHEDGTGLNCSETSSTSLCRRAEQG